MEYSRVKELFDYDPDTGRIFWKEIKPGRSRGKEAGCVSPSGYRIIMVCGKNYRAHRLIWLFIHGYFPENDIDHINRIRSDNRLKNLREVSKGCNAHNKTLQKNNTSGINGVNWRSKECVWESRIKVDRKMFRLGKFKDLVEAVASRLAAEQCLGLDQYSNSLSKIYIENYTRRVY